MSLAHASNFRRTAVRDEFDSGATEPVLSVKGLSVSFGSEAGVVRAVRDVNFDLHPGKTLAIVGESGSGKSVTSLAVMGLLDRNAHVEGSIKFAGEELIGKNDREMSQIRGLGIAMVFQDPLSALTPVLSIGAQLEEALVTHHPEMSADEVRRRSIELLSDVGIPNPQERLRSYPHQFSGGMRQRVIIAMAIANKPKIIIADEPTTALDVTIQAQILDVLRKAQRETGAAVIFITHDLGVVAGIADDVLVMYAGKPVERADVNTLYHRPAMPYTMGLIGAIPRPDKQRENRLTPIPGDPLNIVDLPVGCPFAPRCPLAKDVCREQNPPLKALLSEKSHLSACHFSDDIIADNRTIQDVYKVPDHIASRYDDVPLAQRDVILQVTDLVKTFPLTAGFARRKIGDVHAVNHLSMTIHEGETLALVGESGSGKSTTLLEIIELKVPQGGGISLLGTQVSKRISREDRRRLRTSMQIVFQDPMSSLDPRIPIYDILAEPLKVQGLDRAAINVRIKELMKLVGLNEDQVDRFPTQFSGGQRQRIAIARALAVKPKLILLDEPVSALDVSIQAGIINLLEDLQGELGVSYLFVAHNLSVIRHISQTVEVMYLGHIVEQGATDAVFSNPIHPYTQALMSAVPVPDPVVEKTRQRIVLVGDLPSPAEKILGCPFASRCQLKPTLSPEQQQRCESERPQLVRQSDEGGQPHLSACFFSH